MVWVKRGLICSSLVCLAAAIWVFPGEYKAFQYSSKKAVNWYVEAAVISPPRLRSVEGHYGVLIACDRTMMDFSGQLMPRQRRETVWNKCLATADTVLEYAPDLAAAHLVRAQALVRLGNAPAGIEALISATRVAPELTWIALRRLDIGLLVDGRTSADAIALLTEDIGRLLKSEDGAIGLARRYRGNPDARAFVVETVEALPNESRRAFVSALQRLDETDGG